MSINNAILRILSSMHFHHFQGTMSALLAIVCLLLILTMEEAQVATALLGQLEALVNLLEASLQKLLENQIFLDICHQIYWHIPLKIYKIKIMRWWELKMKNSSRFRERLNRQKVIAFRKEIKIFKATSVSFEKIRFTCKPSKEKIVFKL